MRKIRMILAAAFVAVMCAGLAWSKVCPSCGAEVSDNAKFCPECGEKFSAVQRKSFCPECGEELEGNPKFCPSCGTRLTGSSSSARQSSSSRTRASASVSVPKDFVKLPAGTFTMGADKGVGYDDESPAHRVTLTRAFYMCDHEVTQAEFRSVLGSIPENIDHNRGKGDNYPVYYVTWYAAIAYCNKRSIKEGLTPCYKVDGVSNWASLSLSSVPTSSNDAWSGASCDFDANGYRLPTEAEWEYAARAGDNRSNALTWSGTSSEGSVSQYAWYKLGTKFAREVKKKKPNAKGLYDMSGNVPEWCWDEYDKNQYANDKDGVTDPEGAGSGRVVRNSSGGADSPKSVAVTTRRFHNPWDVGYGSYGSTWNGFGFRVVRTVQ